MANDAADFYVRLHDELTGPARAMRTELKGLKNDLKKFNTGARGARGGVGAGSARREKRATDGIRQPKMLTANDRIRMQEREEKLALRSREKADREQAKRANAQEREAARLRAAMQRDERSKLASIARQDKAFRKSAQEQERAQVRAARERDRAAKKATGEERSRAAYLAHRKVLDGGVGAEVRGMMGGAGAGGGRAASSALSGIGGSSGLGALAAGGAIAAGVAVIASGLMMVKDAALAAAAGVASLAGSFVSASLEAMRFAQTSELALGNLLHGGENARAEFDAVRGMAEHLGLNVEDTVGSFKKLLAAQFEVGRAKELIAMGSDLQGIGANAEEVKRALLAITQIKSKGRLQAEEMLQLQEAGISAELVYD